MKNTIVLLTFIAILKSIQALTCSSDIDCKNYPNKICANRECICKKNYLLQDNKCTALLNTNCVRHNECGVKYSICSPKAKKCRCSYGYYASNDKKICKRFARHLNDTCVETYGCRNLKFSKCSKDKRCVCQEHYIEKFGKCQSSVGGSCKNVIDCGFNNSVCQSGKCQCFDEFIFLDELHTCIKLVVLNNTESSSTESVNRTSEERHSENYENDSRVQSKTCSANRNNDSENVTTSSYPSSTIELNTGTLEKTDSEKYGNNSNVQSTICLGNNCNDSQTVATSSFPSSTIELNTEPPCKNDECKVLEPPNCTPETCINYIGSLCFNDRDCKIENSHCDSSSCQCKDNHVYSPFLKRCVEVD